LIQSSDEMSGRFDYGGKISGFFVHETVRLFTSVAEIRFVSLVCRHVSKTKGK
jgi:hypothetical protein